MKSIKKETRRLIDKRNKSLPDNYVDTLYAIKTRLADTKSDIKTYLMQHHASSKKDLLLKDVHEYELLVRKLEICKRKLKNLQEKSNG